MSSKRHIRLKSCTGKRRYATSQTARNHAWHLMRKTGERVQAYHCPFCKGFHVGHPPVAVQKALGPALHVQASQPKTKQTGAEKAT